MVFVLLLCAGCVGGTMPYGGSQYSGAAVDGLKCGGEIITKEAPPPCPEGWLYVDLRGMIYEGSNVDIEKEGMTEIDGSRIRQVFPCEGRGLEGTMESPGVFLIQEGPGVHRNILGDTPITVYQGRLWCPSVGLATLGEGGHFLYLPPDGKVHLFTIPYPQDGWPEIVVTITNYDDEPAETAASESADEPDGKDEVVMREGGHILSERLACEGQEPTLQTEEGFWGFDVKHWNFGSEEMVIRLRGTIPEGVRLRVFVWQEISNDSPKAYSFLVDAGNFSDREVVLPYKEEATWVEVCFQALYEKWADRNLFYEGSFDPGSLGDEQIPVAEVSLEVIPAVPLARSTAAPKEKVFVQQVEADSYLLRRVERETVPTLEMPQYFQGGSTQPYLMLMNEDRFMATVPQHWDYGQRPFKIVFEGIGQRTNNVRVFVLQDTGVGYVGYTYVKLGPAFPFKLGGEAILPCRRDAKSVEVGLMSINPDGTEELFYLHSFSPEEMVSPPLEQVRVKNPPYPGPVTTREIEHGGTLETLLSKREQQNPPPPVEEDFGPFYPQTRYYGEEEFVLVIEGDSEVSRNIRVLVCQVVPCLQGGESGSYYSFVLDIPEGNSWRRELKLPYRDVEGSVEVGLMAYNPLDWDTRELFFTKSFCPQDFGEGEMPLVVAEVRRK